VSETEAHTHGGDVEFNIPQWMVSGSVILMAVVLTGYMAWSFFDSRKATSVMKEELNRIVREFKEHTPELLVSIAPQVPDDANDE
jgi:hypothetical protein